MYVFGGYNEGNCHNDIYAFDLVRHHWHHIETSNGISPDGRASHAWCASTDQSKLYLFGGSGPHWGQTNMGKLLQFSIRDKNWTIVEAQGTHPPPGYGQSLCSINNKIYLFGGTSGYVYVNDLYVFDEFTRTWKKEETQGNRPSPRYKHQVATIGNRMYVIGGGLYDPPKGPIDTYYLDVDTLTWHEVPCNGAVPRSRIAHTLCQISRDPNRLIMFGGKNDTGTRMNELSELDLKTGTWKIYEESYGQPDARDFHTCVMHEDQLFLFGGSNGVERNNDVHRYTVIHQPPALVILAMQALRQNMHFIPKEEIAALPFELKLGVENINPHVRSTYNTTWYVQMDQKQNMIPAALM
jgi:N-acetylneuraminic acid mutarotase